MRFNSCVSTPSSKPIALHFVEACTATRFIRSILFGLHGSLLTSAAEPVVGGGGGGGGEELSSPSWPAASYGVGYIVFLTL